jgi:signal transduction histidine kinase/ligand-binding sensor domain-containing protein
LWVGGESGVQQWQLDGVAPVRRKPDTSDGMPGVPVRALTTDHLHNLWIGTAKHGLFQRRRHDGRVLAYEHRDGDPHSPAGNSIISLMQDSSGSLWAGTLRRGASRVDLASGGFTRVVHSDPDPEGLSDNTVTAIAAADRGRLWLSTGNGGLNLYDPASGKAQIFRHRDGERASLPDDRVAATVYDRKGRLWVAAGRAVASRDPVSGRYTEIAFRQGDGSTGAVHAMFCDRAGVLWIGTLTGLYSYDTSSGASVSYRRQAGDRDGPASNIIYEIQQDHEGRIWVGTAYGLDRLDPATGRWEHFRHDPANVHSIDHNRVWVLFEDRGGTMWVGTAQGLNRASQTAAGATRFISYPFGTAVDSIEQDDAGQLWVSTDGGLLRFDPVQGTHHWYHSSDGISEGDFQTSSSLHASDGVMYFGSNVGGVTAFRPEQVHGNNIAPKVVLTSIQVLNREVRHGAEPDGAQSDAPIEFASKLTLAHHLNIFSIEFAALHYAAPGRNQYAYQLVGFDQDWVTTSAGRRFASYTNLDPGSYVFRVKASNKDGVWTELAQPLHVTITPPFWSTWWFRILIGSLLLLLACAGYLARVQSYKRREAALTANVRERDAAVEAAVRKLHATQQQLILREKMASVGTLTAGIAHEINNPVNFAHVGAQALDRELENFRTFLMALAGEDADAAVLARLNQHIDLLNNQVGNVIEGTSRIRDLVKDLLSFSRLGEAERKRAAIGDSLLATVNLVRTYYADLVEIDCELGANPQLECWPSLLNQVFMNMIVNACQAIKTRYPDATGQGRLLISSSTEAGELVLAFRDNGCGIAPDQLSRIFEPFYTTKEVGEGTGLGLSTSFGIVAQHGGRIAVVSTPNSGSTFTIYLPLNDEPS